MSEYESGRKEHKVTIVIGVILIALLAIFVAKKRSRPGPEPYGIRPVSRDEGDSIADILSDFSLAEEKYTAGVGGADEISVSVGGRDVAEAVVELPVAVDVTFDEEIVEPVHQEERKEEYTTYVVKKNDTLSVIAQRFYGDSSRWRIIAKANDLKDINMLRIGMELIIPKHQRAEVPRRDRRPEVPSQIDVAVDDGAGAEKARDYTVKKNDSLWKIAKAEYGDGNRWTIVFKANKSSIRNKNLLKAGQVIKLPEH